VAPAVAKAAMDSGVAKNPIANFDAYVDELKGRLGLDNKFMRTLAERARRNPKRVVFAEAESYRVLKAAQTVFEEGVCTPILLGNVNRINELLEEYTIEFGEEIEIIDPKDHALSSKRHEYGAVLFEKRKRKGLTLHEATKLMRDRNYFGAMMVEMGEADSLVSGVSRKYRDVLKPIIEIIGVQKEVEKIAGMIIMLTKRGPMFLADTTVNVNPCAEDLVNITDLVAKAVRRLKLTPRIAMLGYSNFGSSPGDEPNKMRDAVEILHQTQPNLIVDGEVQANFALNNDMLLEKFDFSTLANKQVNTLIFPNLSAGNIAYKMMQEMTDAEVVGPMLLGLKKSAHVLQLGCSVREIVNMVKIAVVDAQSKQ
jgi:malate dehydrogenase (oxaloacetate-decarboxylating)(NADP+)